MRNKHFATFTQNLKVIETPVVFFSPIYFVGAPVFLPQHWKLLGPERLMPLKLLGMNRVNSWGLNVIWCWNVSSWILWYYIFVRLCNQRKWLLFYWPCLKTLMLVCIFVFVNRFGLITNTLELYILIQVYVALTFIQDHMDGRKITSAPIVSKSCQSLLMDIGILLRLVGVMNLILILFHLFISRKRTLLKWLLSRTLNFGLHLDQILSNFISMMIETTELYILMSGLMTMAFIQVPGCLRNEKLLPTFSHKCLIDLDEI